ncbi:hypothetical protein ACQ4PT_025844 [Festuca glaucescens]
MATTPPDASTIPSWILLDSEGYIGDSSDDYNYNTNLAWRREGQPIVVTLRPAHPPTPSHLLVHCPFLGPDQVFRHRPSIVCTAEGFLLRVVIGAQPRRSTGTWPSSPRGITTEMCNYLIYTLIRNESPSLKMLPNPHPRFFWDHEVVLLPHGDCQFTVAALLPTTKHNEFDLHLFRSANWGWSSRKVLLESLQDPFPVPIPVHASYRLSQHVTITTITLGGAGGTVSWVELWSGILLCDVLRDDDNKLRGVSVPLSVPKRLSLPDGLKYCPKPFRGIAIVENNRLKVVELDADGDRLTENDPETRGLGFRIHDWTLTTYTNSKIGSGHDWEINCTVKASDITIDEAARSALLSCGLLREQQNDKPGGATERKLQNMDACQPVPGLDDRGIVNVGGAK